MINRRSLTGWTSGGHTAVDVPIMAHGPGRDRFIGTIDNAEMGQRLLQLIGRDSAD